MRPLTAQSLLEAWDVGHSQTLAERGITLLATAYQEEERDLLARLPVSERDQDLLRIREQIFGSHAQAVVTCPQCGERIDLDLPMAGFKAENSFRSAKYETVECDGYSVQFRFPDTVALSRLTPYMGLERATRTLFEACVESALWNASDVPPEQLPESVVECVAARMEQLDSQGDWQLSLTCPACCHQWVALFDIVSFLWRELESWAEQRLSEVHQIALAYGWREADILAMSAAKRQFYLGALGA